MSMGKSSAWVRRAGKGGRVEGGKVWRCASGRPSRSDRRFVDNEVLMDGRSGVTRRASAEMERWWGEGVAR